MQHGESTAIYRPPHYLLLPICLLLIYICRLTDYRYCSKARVISNHIQENHGRIDSQLKKVWSFYSRYHSKYDILQEVEDTNSRILVRVVKEQRTFIDILLTYCKIVAYKNCYHFLNCHPDICCVSWSFQKNCLSHLNEFDVRNTVHRSSFNSIASQYGIVDTAGNNTCCIQPLNVSETERLFTHYFNFLHNISNYNTALNCEKKCLKLILVILVIIHSKNLN